VRAWAHAATWPSISSRDALPDAFSIDRHYDVGGRVRARPAAGATVPGCFRRGGVHVGHDTGRAHLRS
jgi:hypothetical protein